MPFSKGILSKNSEICELILGKAIIVELGSKNVQESEKKLIAKKFPRQHVEKRDFQNGRRRG